MNRTNLRGLIVAAVTFVAIAGVVAGIAKGVERLTQDGSPVAASFATDVPRTALELEAWRRAAIAGEDTKRELEDQARELAEERRRVLEARRQAQAEARKKAEEEKARKKAEAEARKRAEAEARKQAEADARKQAEADARKQAEADARRKEEARKRAEEEAARKRKEATEQKKSRSAPSGSPKAIARQLVAAKGWGSGQYDCLVSLWTRESNWRVTAENPSSGAYGIPQALPGSKMAAFGDDWRTNPVTQIKWGLDYIKDRYGTPCGAWSAFQSKGWY